MAIKFGYNAEQTLVINKTKDEVKMLSIFDNKKKVKVLDIKLNSDDVNGVTNTINKVTDGKVAVFQIENGEVFKFKRLMTHLSLTLIDTNETEYVFKIVMLSFDDLLFNILKESIKGLFLDRQNNRYYTPTGEWVRLSKFNNTFTVTKSIPDGDETFVFQNQLNKIKDMLTSDKHDQLTLIDQDMVKHKIDFINGADGCSYFVFDEILYNMGNNVVHQEGAKIRKQQLLRVLTTPTK